MLSAFEVESRKDINEAEKLKQEKTLENLTVAGYSKVLSRPYNDHIEYYLASLETQCKERFWGEGFLSDVKNVKFQLKSELNAEKCVETITPRPSAKFLARASTYPYISCGPFSVTFNCNFPSIKEVKNPKKLPHKDLEH